MSRPRKPYGQNPPGRLLGTMVKVLAAEMSDQGRLSRGKRYWADDAVLDIVVGHGAVSAEIQGSRRQPYVVTIEAAAGDGVPGRRDIWATCTCPDDTGTGVDLCKHAVAALFALADEITVEPELIDRWRSGSRRRDATSAVGDEPTPWAPVRDIGRHDDDDDDDDVDDDDDDDDDGDDDDASVAEVIELRPRHGVGDDVISALLRSSAGAAPPEFGEVTELDHGPIRNRLLREVFDDVLDHLAIRWE